MAVATRSGTVTTAGGGAGTSTGTANIGLGGVCKVHAIFIDYTSAAGATLDVTITDAATGANVLTQANSATDKMYYPRRLADKAADGTASAITEVPAVASDLLVSVAQANVGDTVRVVAYVET